MQRSLPFDLNRIANNTNLTINKVRKSTIPTDKLEEIYNDYLSNKSNLESTRIDIIGELNKKVSSKCHSIRSRVKDPDHLIAKIIRNAFSKGGKYLSINKENYLCRINDLVAVRILLLRQSDFKAVHEAILELYENDPSRYVIDGNYDDNIKNYEGVYLAEEPVVYITSRQDKVFYENIENLRVCDSNQYYRSAHYIVRKGDIFFEIQVRTLFEEGWLEFDHNIKYPNDVDNERKAQFLHILNLLSVAADEYISLYSIIEPYMDETKDKISNQDPSNGEINVGNQENDVETEEKSTNDKVLALF